MRVTLNIFSGRPNPTWSLPRRKTDELVERLTVTGPPVSAEEPLALGFRGFTVDADLADLATRPGLPARFIILPPAATEVTEEPQPQGKERAYATAASARWETQRAAAKDTSEWLLSTVPDALEKDVLEAARFAIRQESPPAAAAKEAVKGQRRTMKPAEEQTIERALEDAACNPFLTPMQDAFWNDPSRRFRNNCYNYASNFASFTMAQPGRRSGHIYTAFDCGDVSVAAKFDGVLSDCRGTVRVVAMAIWPGTDFHWWRLHPGGFWAHKIGASMVMQRDNLGRILGNGLTPANCDRGPYTVFCGFFFVPLGVEVM
jgi:hypothetical protein